MPSAPDFPAYAYQTDQQYNNTYLPNQDIPGIFSEQSGQYPYPYTPTLGQPFQTPVPAPQKISSFARPFPLWVLIVGALLVLALLGVLQATGSDWADGAIHAAIGAVSIAVGFLLLMGLRTILGMANPANANRQRQYIGAALVVVVLFAYSGLDLIGQTSLHMLQAHFLEGQQNWQQALNEYQLSGEKAPSSAELARVYDEWGEALTQSGQYVDAISKFNITIGDYVTPVESARAQKDEVNAYLDLGKQFMSTNDYSNAVKRFDIALGLTFCHTECQNLITPFDATAYYKLARAQLDNGQYNNAVDNFETVQTRFATYPEAKQVHSYLATALLGKGKQERTTLCSSAIPTYQQLAKNFADTPEGKEASSELGKPQSVTGHFIQPLPTNGIAMVALVQNFSTDLTAEQGFAIIDSSPNVLIHNDGTFTFPSVNQGTYALVWSVDFFDGSRVYIFYYRKNDPAKSAYYVANVGPLCPVDIGDIAESISQ